MDSATNLRIVSVATVDSAQQEEHRLRGWAPRMAFARARNNGFFLEYALQNYPCSTVGDTTLRVTLQVTDSNGEYVRKDMPFEWHLTCEGPNPLPTYDSVEIALQRNP